MVTGSPEVEPGLGPRSDERVLTLPFECLKSLPEGVNEVRVWRDQHLGVNRVGKRIDLSTIADDSLPEAATLQAVQHRHVVPVLTVAEVSGFPQPMRVVELVTPYYERGSVTDALLTGHTFWAREAVQVTQAVLRGLAYLHDVHQICHRDVKSGNILLCDENVARVADLGLAGRITEDGTVAAVNNPTLYSSPEFATTATLTPASDIFGVGLVMRELLGGAFPYANYPRELVLRRLSEQRTVISGADLILPVWASSSLRRIYAKATHRDPAKRYQRARAMDDDLSQAVVVDWSEVDTGRRWEAPTIRSGYTVAVESKPMTRTRTLRLSTYINRGRSWRRALETADVDSLSSTAARNVFDQASRLAAAH